LDSPLPPEKRRRKGAAAGKPSQTTPGS